MAQGVCIPHSKEQFLTAWDMHSIALRGLSHRIFLFSRKTSKCCALTLQAVALKGKREWIKSGQGPQDPTATLR
jgi:hypothetical protein